MEELALRLMTAFAEALELENNFFQRSIDKLISAVRALIYPAPHGVITDKQKRAGAHTA